MPTNDQPSASKPEYLGAASPARTDRSSGRRVPLVALAAVGVVGVVAAGGWAALSLMSTGEQPAMAVPADAVAYVSLDLDPSAEQKLEAISIIKKFPALDEELGLDPQDDLRRWAFEEMLPDSCPDVDFDDHVEPWIGDRMAVAVLPGEGEAAEPVPMLALQVTDQEEAAAGLDRLSDCAVAGDQPADGEPEELGYAFAGDYVVVAETAGAAEEIAAAERTLGEDETFVRWTEEVGDPGIATVYVAPAAISVIADAQAQSMDDMLDDPAMGGMGGMPFGPGFGMGGTEDLEKLAEDFEGMASVLRFRDGAVEVEVAGGGLPEGYDLVADRRTGVAALPAGTGAALAFAVPEDWAADWLESMDEMSGMPVDRMLAEAERETGLQLPEDLETLLGDGVSIALDSSVDPSALEEAGPQSVPAGVRVEGDPEAILPIIEKIRSAWGPGAAAMVVESGDGAVAFGTNKEYVATLAGDGGLGDVESFQAAVPDADRAAAVMYVDFEAGDAWVERLVVEVSQMFGGGGGEDPEVHRNMDALEAMGASSWVDGEVVRGLFRLTTD